LYCFLFNCITWQYHIFITVCLRIICMYMYIYIYIHTHTYIHICVCVCMYMTSDFFYISQSLVVPPVDHLNMNKTMLYYTIRQEMNRHFIYVCECLKFWFTADSNSVSHLCLLFIAGEVLAVEKPFASVLLPDCYWSHCYNCLKHCHSLLPCSHCSTVHIL